MAFIATGSNTVGEVVDSSLDFLLGGMFRERTPGKGVTQRDIATNAAARRAIEVVREHLNELYCGDADTLFRDVPVPTAKPKVVPS